VACFVASAGAYEVDVPIYFCVESVFVCLAMYFSWWALNCVSVCACMCVHASFQMLVYAFVSVCLALVVVMPSVHKQM
jgi:hypothetical protein